MLQRSPTCPPQTFHFPRGDLNRRLIPDFLSARESVSPNGMSISSAAFAGLTIVTNKETDRETDRQTHIAISVTSVAIARTIALVAMLTICRLTTIMHAKLKVITCAIGPAGKQVRLGSRQGRAASFHDFCVIVRALSLLQIYIGSDRCTFEV